MSTHRIIATPAEEAHFRRVLDAWQAERGCSRTALSKLLTGTDVLLPFWSGARPISQPLLDRTLIGCKAAGIEATIDTLLGVRQPNSVPLLEAEDDERYELAIEHADAWEELVARVARLEVIYSALMFQQRLEALEQRLGEILTHGATLGSPLEVASYP